MAKIYGKAEIKGCKGRIEATAILILFCGSVIIRYETRTVSGLWKRTPNEVD